MKYAYTLAALGLLLSPLAACESPASPATHTSLLIETSQPSYSLAEGSAAVITMRHHGGPPVVVSGCPSAPSAILERRAADSWTQEATRGMICPGIYTTQVDTVGDGETRQFSMAPWRSGHYRVRVLIGTSASSPEWTILSNEFDVH